MNQPLPPWSLHWSSNGELSPMDRADLAPLFLALHHPPLTPFPRGAATSERSAQAPRPQPWIYYFPTAKP